MAGKPLIAWTIQESLKSKYLTDYVVSTDSLEVANKSEYYGAKVVDRPDVLSQDDTRSLDALKHAYWSMGEDYDAVALIPCTTPLRNVEDIDTAITILMLGEKYDSVIGMTPSTPIERVKRIRVGSKIEDTYPEPQDGQRQRLPGSFVRSGIYVVRTSRLDRLFGHEESHAYIIPRERGVNIDDEFDWKVAEMLLKEREGLI